MNLQFDCRVVGSLSAEYIIHVQLCSHRISARCARMAAISIGGESNS